MSQLLGQGLEISLVGMGLTFASLGLLVLVMVLLERAFRRAPADEPPIQPAASSMVSDALFWSISWRSFFTDICEAAKCRLSSRSSVATGALGLLFIRLPATYTNSENISLTWSYFSAVIPSLNSK